MRLAQSGDVIPISPTVFWRSGEASRFYFGVQMKKERKRNIKDYSAYDELDMEYHGLFIKKGKLRIDMKRLKKEKYLTFFLTDSIFEDINKQPRSTAYFFLSINAGTIITATFLKTT
jgi:hypothetical protein